MHPGKQIRKLALQQGMRPIDLANKMGVTKQYVCEILNGRCGLSLDICDKLADVLGETKEYWAEINLKWRMEK